MSKTVNDVVSVGTFGLVKDVSGVEGAQKAAKRAAGVQADAALTAEQGINRRFDLTQASLQPSVEAGDVAREQQRILLGLGSGRTDPNADRRQELEAQIAGLQSDFDEGSQFSGANLPSGGGFLGGALGKISGRISEQQASDQAGRQSQIDALTQELGGLPEFTQQTAQQEQEAAFAAFNESPGQKFLRERGERATIRNAGKIGGLGGGNVRKALTEFGIGTAQQDFNNQFGRLGQLAGQGQSAATNVGQFGATAANQAGQFGIAGSQARASGILGAQQAEGQFRSDLIGLAGQAAGAFAGSPVPAPTGVR